MERIASKLLDRAERRAADFDLDAAERLLGEAARTWPDHSRLVSTRRKIDAAAISQKRLAAALPTAAVDTQKVSKLLQQAAVAAANGNLLSPPGASAYDLYRVVLSLEPDNAEASQGLAALAQKASGAAIQALDMRQLTRAEGYIQSLQTLDASDAALPALRRRLAGAYLALAVERLEGGRIKSASEAVQKAREIDANHPDLTSIMARLEHAGG
jgi:tetratricopeptide (TPR) repeat protein